LVELPLGPVAGRAVEILDPSFTLCIDPDAVLHRLWTGGRWAEGPAWLEREGILVWSDIPANRLWRWRAADGAIAEYRHPSESANGNTHDRQGRLVTCEQDKRRITRTELDGQITVLAGVYGGKRFTGPNDVVVKSDGSIWFTDPDYARGGALYEGPVEIEGCHVYRIDGTTGDVRQMTTDMVMPNGLAFSPDETTLYVVDTGSTHRPDGPNHIRAFRVGQDTGLTPLSVSAVDEGKAFDGLRVDTDGRLWAGNGQGVTCYLPSGQPIGRIRVPERVANLEFAGPDRNQLMLCGTTSLYMIPVRARPSV
jgi:gluconolactonase